MTLVPEKRFGGLPGCSSAAGDRDAMPIANAAAPSLSQHRHSFRISTFRFVDGLSSRGASKSAQDAGACNTSWKSGRVGSLTDRPTRDEQT